MFWIPPKQVHNISGSDSPNPAPGIHPKRHDAFRVDTKFLHSVASILAQLPGLDLMTFCVDYFTKCHSLVIGEAIAYLKQRASI